jgi:hypothetical protein
MQNGQACGSGSQDCSELMDICHRDVSDVLRWYATLATSHIESELCCSVTVLLTVL